MTYEDKHFLEELENKFVITNGTEYKDVVNFQDSINQPIQRWYPYREGYSYKLIEKIINDYNIDGVLLDPFVGSGSSLLAGRKSGLKTYGIDVNPLSTFISKTENRIYSAENLHNLSQLRIDFLNSTRDVKERVTNFNLADRYFNQEILQSLLQFREKIGNIEQKHERDIFFLAWLSIIESVSNVKKEGNGVKYKNRKRGKKGYKTTPIEEWEDSVFPSDKFEFIKNEIISKIDVIMYDIENYGLNAQEPTVMIGDSIELVKEIKDSIQLTVFSPPYVNFFDYFEIHKMELWLGNFISNRKDLNELKKNGFRSTGSSLGKKEIVHENYSVKHLVNLLSNKKLWSKQIPSVVEGYFDDMESLLSNIYNITEESGYVFIIVGNSAYGGILIPTDLLIAEIGEKIGFAVEEIKVTRHLTTSSQQRSALEDVLYFMRESIIILKK